PQGVVSGAGRRADIRALGSDAKGEPMLTGSSRDIELARPVTGEEGHDFEAVVGWRAWVAAPTGGAWRLWSATRSLSWPVRRPTVAACERCSSPPGAGCGCGIHALREPEAAMRAAAPSDGALGWNALAAVLGRVVLFGHVREHEGEWRAERAYPAHLYVVA